MKNVLVYTNTVDTVEKLQKQIFFDTEVSLFPAMSFREAETYLSKYGIDYFDVFVLDTEYREEKSFSQLLAELNEDGSKVLIIGEQKDFSTMEMAIMFPESMLFPFSELIRRATFKVRNSRDGVLAHFGIRETQEVG